MSLFITFLLGLFILLGALIAKLTGNHALIKRLSIAIAFGTMLTMGLTDLLPEAAENLAGVTAAPGLIAAGAVVGFAVLKVLDRFIPDHDTEELSAHHDCTEENVAHIGIITTIAVSVHNLIEGMAVFSVACGSLRAGLLVGLGVGLHNIPMGMIIFSTLMNEPLKKKAGFLTAAALSTFAGGLVMFALRFAIDDFIIGLLISLTLGMIAYIVFMELLGHILHDEHRLQSALGVVVGVAIVLVSAAIGGE